MSGAVRLHRREGVVENSPTEAPCGAGGFVAVIPGLAAGAFGNAVIPVPWPKH